MKTLIVALGIAALALVSTQAADKKAEKCPVSGETLGEHGKPYVFKYEGEEVKLCCKSCVKDFKKDPAKYLKKMKEGK